MGAYGHTVLECTDSLARFNHFSACRALQYPRQRPAVFNDRNADAPLVLTRDKPSRSINRIDNEGPLPGCRDSVINRFFGKPTIIRSRLKQNLPKIGIDSHIRL